MIIGVDFDNTIVCYDAIFHRIAMERGLIPPEVPPTKTAVRDYLRAAGMDPVFTELQGYVYGPRLVEAEAFPGVKDFFRACRASRHIVKIISHKTRFPYAGERHDLHAAARRWLEHNGFFAVADLGLPVDAVFFELTKAEKLARIKAEACDVFIDDLPELLAEPAFPPATRRVLFDPMAVFPDDPLRDRARSWADVHRLIFGPEAETDAQNGTLAAAQRLFEQAGLRLAGAPVRVPGGGNNRVFEARDGQGTRFLLKQYFASAGDQRDRFDSERRFYRLAKAVVPLQTARALGWDATTRVGLFEFVDGRRLMGTEIGVPEVNAALNFFRALNRARELPEAQALPVAAEACFTIEEHCRTVERRIERLRGILGDTTIERDARRFAETELLVAWSEVRATVLACADRGKLLTTAERCISPSDFGFHNVLRRPDASLVFLDFEYAGWDDPAKTVCDFFCQPALPVPASCFEMFVTEVGRVMSMEPLERFVVRCRVLLPLYRVKWCGIILNEFVRSDHGRRAFALGAHAAEERKAEQLSAARRCLASVREIFHGTAA